MTEQGVGAKLAEALKGGAGRKPGGSYTPIMKALEQIGIEPKVMPVMIGDMPIDCVVIPAQELLVKEYAILSGVDPNLLLGDKTPPPASEPANGQPGEAAPSIAAPRQRPSRAKGKLVPEPGADSDDYK
jgi:hypothetical protein